MFKPEASMQYDLGAEEFGSATSTAIQTVTQYATDMTGLQKNIIYAVGVGVVAYIAYRLYYGE